MLKPRLITPPAAPLVSLEEAKAHCRVDHSDDDELIKGLVNDVTDWLDGYGGVLERALINQTWRTYLSCWPPCKIRFPLAPVSTIISVKYFDANNAEQTLQTMNYWEAPLEDPLSPFLAFKPNASLPTLYERLDAIAVDFIAGFGGDATSVPAKIIRAAKLLIGHYYENREASIVGTSVAEQPLGVASLIAPASRVSF